jgi:transposase
VMNKILGVDISKSWLDAGQTDTQKHRRLPYTIEGLTDLAAQCRADKIDLVVMEASGNYERQAFLTLSALGMPCAIVNPRSVRNYAKAMGRFEKTDRIDAQMIAQYALAKHIAAMPPPAQNQQKLAALSARMHQITKDSGDNKKRLASITDQTAQDSIKAVIRLLEKQHRDITAQMQALIDADPLWTLINNTLRSVKGVADRTVHTLIAEMPELGHISNRAAAKLTGLAPLPDQSGKRDGRRHIHGGRAPIRAILFIVANTVAKFDPKLADMKQRMLHKGAKKMEARIAIARKLIVWLNAKVRDALRENTLSA